MEKVTDYIVMNLLTPNPSQNLLIIQIDYSSFFLLRNLRSSHAYTKKMLFLPPPPPPKKKIFNVGAFFEGEA